MTLHRMILLLIGLGLAALGCTPQERFGKEAFYSPAHRGYVLARESYRHRPLPGTEVVVLTDPLTGTKIKCREGLEPYLEPIVHSTSEQVSRENTTLVSAIVLAPVVGVGVDFAIAGLSVASLAQLPEMLRFTSPDSHVEMGLSNLKEKEFADARWHFESALMLAPSLAMRRDLFYQLALAYEGVGDKDLSEKALIAFVDRSHAREEKKYEDAEARLAEAGRTTTPCESQAPVSLSW